MQKISKSTNCKNKMPDKNYLLNYKLNVKEINIYIKVLLLSTLTLFPQQPQNLFPKLFLYTFENQSYFLEQNGPRMVVELDTKK